MEAVLDREIAFSPEPPDSAGASSSVAELRRRAFERFERLGFPGPRDEAWRYTGVQPITGTNWTLTPRRPRLSTSAQEGVRVRILPASVRELPADLSSIAAFQENAFAALNTAFLGEVVVV